MTLRVVTPSAIEKVDVRLIEHAYLLHCLSQIRGLGKCLCALEILCLEKKNDFIRVVSTPKKVLLGKASLNALGKVGIVPALPF
jgi:hypothetical protein